MAIEVFGKLRSEELAEQSLKCRRLVNDIVNVGVTDHQIWIIMYNLALELENNDDMKMATDFIKEYKGSTLFLSAKVD